MLAYVGVLDRDVTIVVDGYSSAKTVKGALNEFGRWINRSFDGMLGDALIVQNGSDAKDLLTITPELSCGGFFVEVQEVGCASSLNESTDEMEYKEGYNWYVCCRMVK